MVQIPQSHIDLLTRPILVALATVMPDGQPQVTPVWADTIDGTVRVNTVDGRQKYRNLHDRPQATVLVVDPDNPGRWMEIRGKMVFESTGDDRAVIEKLSQDYLGTAYPDHNDADRRVTFHIAPTHVVTAG